MYLLKQSTSITIPIFAFDANGDGVTGKVDGDWTKRISKNGGAFAAMTVTISEMENGFYSVTISTSHSDTLGILTCSFVASGVKRVNVQFRVSARLVDDLATQASLDVVDDFVDTEVAAILAKVNNLPADPADASDIAAAFAVTNGKVDAVKVDTAAINAKTANLPVDPADASDIAASFAGVNTKLDTIDDFVDTEVAAILAKVNNLPSDPADASDIAALFVTVNTKLDSITTGLPLDATELNAIADAILKRDWTSVSGEAARSMLNALRFLRNKWSVAGGTLTVTKEDDTTTVWTAVVSGDAAAIPIVGSDPA